MKEAVAKKKNKKQKLKQRNEAKCFLMSGMPLGLYKSDQYFVVAYPAFIIIIKCKQSY